MKKPTQKDAILGLLRNNPSQWFKSWELQKRDTPYGWIGSEARKRCFELTEAGLLEARPNGKYMEYRAAKPKHEVVYRTKELGIVGVDRKY